MNHEVPDKGTHLLAFLKATATIRRRRISSYGAGDRVIWLGDVPRGHAECRSPFLVENPDDLGESWLEVRKKRMPIRPPVPEDLTDWVRIDDLDQVETEPELYREITVLVEVQQVALKLGSPPEMRPELRRLADYPSVEDAWLEYLVTEWEPWAKEMRRWQEVQGVYENMGFIRRRLEEAEERYEFLLTVGLLQWRDPVGTTVKRHILTAPAEITLDAARGLLTVVPAASFERFRIEVDMLELKHQPILDMGAIESQLDEIDIQAWKTTRLAPVLRGIANCLHADAQVDEERLIPADRAEERPLISYAPALVLRERRPTAYDELIRKFLETAGDGGLESTKPWNLLLREGDVSEGAAGDSRPDQDHCAPGQRSLERFLFPLPANDEQREIVYRLRHSPCVLVKGPPGTGKSHTIANLICHLLAMGDRILVTAQAPKALAVLGKLLPDGIRDLCVTALGSSREDQRLLEESVRGILRRKNEWRGSMHDQGVIDQTEKRLLPAWVMPLHRLWDMTDAEARLFDTVIADEASQASIDSLALLLLAKRIIIVGDDKQNSPEAVGVPEDGIARLTREHLKQFMFREECRPDTSLFDHAERSFEYPITLREHFRCVPEIIRFSNDLCYRDAPLVPLRQASPNRLPPMESRFIAKGTCEGKGTHILNRAEANAIVDEIENIIDDDDYKGKSIGVIALQGHAQAHLIEQDLAKRLDPRTIE